VKLGGLTLPLHHPTAFTNPSAAVLAQEWRRHIETCIELFGTERCMFESNYPVESAAGSYSTIWTAFKLLAAGCSDGEREALFSGTASRVYRVDVSAEP
jgi:predicted TIM-barrel fold metal-dependent hydrolase